MIYSFRNIALVSGDKFRSDLYSVVLPLYDKLIHSYSNITSNSFNKHFNQMINAILVVINLHAPLQSATRKQKRLFQKPWITKGLITSIKHKQRLYRTHFLIGNTSERHFYKKYANKLTRLKNLSKKMFYKEALNVNKSDSKGLWKLINSVILNKRVNNPKVKKLTENNIDFEELEGISEQFNKFFVEIGQEIANNANSETSNENFRTYLTKSVNSIIVFDPLNSLEIYNAINALNPHKACGCDDISAAFLRLGNEVLAPFLSAYFEIVLEFVFFPQIFKLPK